MVPLMLALCMEVYLLVTMVVTGRFWAMIVALTLAGFFGGAWFVFPAAMRSRRQKP
jgi:hypothetical protein